MQRLSAISFLHRELVYSLQKSTLVSAQLLITIDGIDNSISMMEVNISRSRLIVQGVASSSALYFSNRRRCQSILLSTMFTIDD